MKATKRKPAQAPQCSEENLKILHSLIGQSIWLVKADTGFTMEIYGTLAQDGKHFRLHPPGRSDTFIRFAPAAMEYEAGKRIYLK